MNLKTIYFVRHGKMDKNGNSDPGLSTEGIRDIMSIAKQIGEEVTGLKIGIMSSAKFRAEMSADIICRTMGIRGYGKYEICDALTADLDAKNTAEREIAHGNIEQAIVEKAEKDECDVMICVGHEEAIRQVPYRFAKNVLKVELPALAWEDINPGHVRVLDCTGEVKIRKLVPIPKE